MPPTLAGAKVTLRAPTDEDLPFLLAFSNDPELRGYLRFTTPTTEARERAWLRGLDDRHDRVWIMAHPRDARAVGCIGLHGIDWIARSAEVGLGILRPDERGAGVGEASLRLVLDHAFRAMNLQRVWLHVLDDNPAARLYERLGFRHEGRARRAHYKRGAWRDGLMMGLLREEWRA